MFAYSEIKGNYLGEFPGDPVVRLSTLTSPVLGTIPGWGTNIPQA